MIAPAADAPPFSPRPLSAEGEPSAAQPPLDAFPSFLRNEQALLDNTAGQQGRAIAFTRVAMALFSSLLDVAPEAVQEEASQDNTTAEEEALALQSILQSLQALLHPLQAGITLPGQASDVSQQGGGLQPYGAGVLAGSTMPLTQGSGAFPPPEEVSGANPMTLLNATANSEHRLASMLDFSSQLQAALSSHALGDPAQLQETDQKVDIQRTVTQGEGHVLQDTEPVMQLPPHFPGNGGTEGRSAVSALPTAETRSTHLVQQTAAAALELATQQPERLMPRHTLLLQLHPPELGTMQIRVRLANEQLSASFWADSPEVRALLQAHFPSLQQSLSVQGFQVQGISLSFAAGDFAGHPEQSAQQQTASQSWTHNQQPPMTAEGGREAIATSVVRHGLARHGFVDVII